MRNYFNRATIALLTALGVSLAAANATTVIPPLFEELADRADLMFGGNVVSVRGEWRNIGVDRAIFTMVRFETEEILKGDAEKAPWWHGARRAQVQQ